MSLGVFLASAGVSGSSELWPGAWSPVTLQALAAFTYGQVGYLSADNSVRLADANVTEAQATAICMCVESGGIGIGNSGRFVFGGRVPDLSGGVFNTLAFLSNTPGNMQNTPNVTPGEYNVQLGYWLSPTDFQFDPQTPILN